MSSQNQDEASISFSPPTEVDDWLAEVATRRGDSREEVCRRLVGVAHAIATDDEFEPVGPADLAAVRDGLEAHREEVTDLIEDVRTRIVQVKREADAKAPTDHGHPELATDSEHNALEAELAALETTVERGFENFETVLETLLDETDDLSHRSTVLARAIVRVREDNSALSDRLRHREATDDLRLAANRLEIRTAVCEDCGSSVDIALLTAPACPHCGTEFVDVEERSSILGSHRLLAGEPPALEGTVGNAADSTTDEIFEAVEDAADRSRDVRSGSVPPTGDGGTR